MADSGAQVKVNLRLHARILIAYSSYPNYPPRGIVVLGSFDYNTECIGKERYDAGIRTQNPDLLKKAIDFFEEVWNDSGTQTLDDFSKGKK